MQNEAMEDEIIAALVEGGVCLQFDDGEWCKTSIEQYLPIAMTTLAQSSWLVDVCPVLVGCA